MIRLEFTVAGDPAPQGSKRHVGKGIMVEASKKTRPWRALLTDAAIRAAQEQGWATATGPVSLSLTFAFRRPKAHFNSRGMVKPNAPALHSHAPDADKLARAVLDSLTVAAVYRDDGQVATLAVSKTYGERPGVRVSVAAFEEGSK